MHMDSPGVELACSGGLAPSTEMLNVRAFCEGDVRSAMPCLAQVPRKEAEWQRYTNARPTLSLPLRAAYPLFRVGLAFDHVSDALASIFQTLSRVGETKLFAQLIEEPECRDEIAIAVPSMTFFIARAVLSSSFAFCMAW